MPPPAKRARRPKGAATPAAAGGSGVGGRTPANNLRRALAWLNNYPKACHWMNQYDIVDLVDSSGGLCRVENFLPKFVAEGALQIMQRLPPGRWRPTEAEQDYTHNNIAHAFWSIKGGMGGGGEGGEDGGGGGGDEELEALLRAFTLLLPGQFNAFSVARYDRGHHIAPHDDRAYTPVLLDTGEVISCSRDLACIYYLTKDWEESMGGALVDLEAPASPGGEGGSSPAGTAAGAAGGAAPGAAGAAENGGSAGSHAQQQPQRRQWGSGGRVYVPRFNSVVFFRVPRYHTVTPLMTDRPRYSVFGWFLQPGKLYELFTGEEGEEGPGGPQQAGQAALLPPCGEEGEEGEEGEQQQQQQAKQRRKQRQRQAAQQLAGGQPPDHADEEAEEEEQAAADGAPQCKLAQRLLTKLAAKKRRQGTAG